MGRGPPRGQAQQETRSWRGKGRGVTRTSEPGLPVAEGDSLAPSHLGLGPASGRSAPPGSCRQRQKEAARMRPWAPDRLRGPEPRFAARARARASEEGRPRPSGALGSGRGGACACRWLGGRTRPLHVGGRDSPELQLHPPAVEQDGGGLVVHTCERGSAEGLGCKAPLSRPSSKGSPGAGWGCTGRVGGPVPVSPGGSASHPPPATPGLLPGKGPDRTLRRCPPDGRMRSVKRKRVGWDISLAALCRRHAGAHAHAQRGQAWPRLSRAATGAQNLGSHDLFFQTLSIFKVSSMSTYFFQNQKDQ